MKKNKEEGYYNFIKLLADSGELTKGELAKVPVVLARGNKKQGIKQKVKQKIKRFGWEGIIRKGNFYLKMPSGKYFSVNSLSYVEGN